MQKSFVSPRKSLFPVSCSFFFLPMPRLFWKIFGWFWGAMILIGLALYTVVLTTRPEPMPLEWRKNTGLALRATATVMVSEWERGGAPALRTAQRSAQRGGRVRLRLLDAKGERLGRPAGDAEDANSPNNRQPSGADKARNPNFPTIDSRFADDDNAITKVRERFRKMVEQANKSGQPVFELFNGRVVVALRETSEAGVTYVLVADLPLPESGRPAANARAQLIGGAVALVLSGLVCWGLVRYLTAPLILLRNATQKLAAGDLAARTGANRNGRRDEVGDLGRDFDIMAGRIESLVEGQRQLLGDISHELRSPLARLRMAGALGRRQIESGAAGVEFTPAFERITRETGRLDALIGQLLDLTRLENGGHGEFESVNVTELVKEIADDARFEARTCNKRVELGRADDFSMQGERALLSSAIENVVRNALRHTPENTAVEIALETSASGAQIRVRDHGAGVPDETLERIFEPFFRVEEARDRQSGGAGLGLAIVQRAINAHGGKVCAHNAANGGLEVELELPAQN